MTFEEFRDVLAWCTVINLALLLAWFAFFVMARDWMHRLHGKWFRLSDESFDRAHYAAMAFFKLGILLFNLVPYLACRIVG